MNKPHLKLPAKKSLFFAMLSYCLKSNRAILSDYQNTNLPYCWTMFAAAFRTKGPAMLLPHLLYDRKKTKRID
jgi:hypothetical protein